MANRNSRAVPIQDDDINDSLWDSPVKPAYKVKNDASSSNPKSRSTSKPTYEEQQSREEHLRQELAIVREVNDTIEGVIESLEHAKGNIKVQHAWLWYRI